MITHVLGYSCIFAGWHGMIAYNKYDGHVCWHILQLVLMCLSALKVAASW